MKNKEIAMQAMKELFVNRDFTALDRYWEDPHTQHNPDMENGLQGIRNVLPYVPENFTYDTGILVEEADLVIAHSRVSGWGPKPQIIVDIFRFENGKIVEHWECDPERSARIRKQERQPHDLFRRKLISHQINNE